MPYKHLGTANAYQRKRRRNLLKAGKCVTCGKAPLVPGLQRCLPCQEKAREASRRGIARRRGPAKKLGFCLVCLIRIAITGMSWCGYCAEAQLEMKAEKRAAKRMEKAA